MIWRADPHGEDGLGWRELGCQLQDRLLDAVQGRQRSQEDMNLRRRKTQHSTETTRETLTNLKAWPLHL